MEKSKLLQMIQMYDFCCFDLNLYLDSHPYCKEALDLFKKYNTLSKKAKEEYCKNYGPLEVSMMGDNDDYHRWVQGLWPWEMED